MLWDFFCKERLGEMEAWAVLCQGCELQRQKLVNIGTNCLYGDIYEQFIVSDRRLELSEHGMKFNEKRNIANVRDYLPQKMKPLLELTKEDLGRVGVFSLAKLVLANIENIKSKPLYSLLSSALQMDISQVPLLENVYKTCLNIISQLSAARMISSMYFKHQGRCKQEYGARNFSTIRSLPSLSLHSDFNEEDTVVNKKLNTFLSQQSLRRKAAYEPTEENEKSISGVCSYIMKKNDKSNDVFNLLDLPGLKYNRNSFADKTDNNQNNISHTLRVNMIKNGGVGQTVKIVLLNYDVMEVTLTAREVITNELLQITLDKLQMDPNDFHLFCLCKKVRGEYLYLNKTGKLADFMTSGTSTFHLRLIKPPGMQMRKLYSKFLSQTDNFGTFRYTGRENKGDLSGSVQLTVDACGMKINDSFVLWRNVCQVSFSHTYLQILYKTCNEDQQRLKICFSAAKTKFIYDLVIFLINVNKEVEKTKEKELSNLDDLCDQLMKITRTALKVMTTPSRKRTKSVDNELSKSAAKKQKLLNPSLGFPERKRNKNPVNPFQYQYKLYLENEEDEIYVHMDKLQRTKDKENIPKTKPRIATNPNIKNDAILKPFPSSGPRHGPVIMGTTTLKRKMTNNFETEPSKKIACVSMTKMEFLSLKVSFNKSEENIFIDQVYNQTKKKLIKGDKVVAVNGKTLENCSLEKANFIIANSGHLLNFILQR